MQAQLTGVVHRRAIENHDEIGVLRIGAAGGR
jgi:hypothetical protein